MSTAIWDEFSITGEGEGSALVKDTEDAPASSKGLLKPDQALLRQNPEGQNRFP